VSNAFRRLPADLVVTAQEMRLEAGLGSLFVTITNAGTEAVDSVMLTLVARGMRATGSEWTATAPRNDPVTIENRRFVVGLEPGDWRTVEVNMRMSTADTRSGSLSVTVVAVLGEEKLTDEAADANPVNNEKVEVALRFD
jgi:hypothetical protein